MFLKNKSDGLALLLEKAAIEPGCRPSFYKALLSSNIYILINKISEHLRNQITLEDNKTISVVTWKKSDGVSIIPIFTSKIEVARGNKENLNYICINAEKFFKKNPGEWYVINPYSDYYKEFTPSEIQGLIDGSLLKTSDPHILPKDTRILISQPLDYPYTLVKSLSVYFVNQEKVNCAYLAQIHNVETDKTPHLLIAVDLQEKSANIFSELTVIINGFIKPDEYIDIIQIGKSNELDDYFKKIEPFYKKKNNFFIAP